MFEVYTGPHILGLGHPMAIVTSMDDDDHVIGEHFLLLSESPQFIRAHGVRAKKSPSPYNDLNVDQQYVRRVSRDMAQGALHAHVDEVFRKERALSYAEIDLSLRKNETFQALVALHLRGSHRAILRTIARETRSDRLQSYLTELLKQDIVRFEILDASR